MRWALVVCVGCRWHFDTSDQVLGSVDSLPGDGVALDGDAGTTATPSMVYASTQTQIYRIDQTTLVETAVMPLCSNVAGFQISDFAISSTGEIIVADLASTALHRADASGNCTLIRTLAVRQYGLAFVPAGVLGPTEVLLGAGDTSNLYRIDTTTGSLQLVGPFGYQPGDLVWTGAQLLASFVVGTTFHLGVVSTTTGAVTDIGDTTYNSVYGLVFANGALFGFSSSAGTFELDPATGAVLRGRAATPAWYGAAGGP